jgi:hypothetical protein
MTTINSMRLRPRVFAPALAMISAASMLGLTLASADAQAGTMQASRTLAPHPGGSQRSPCGPVPHTPGAWRCVARPLPIKGGGRPGAGTETTKVGVAFQTITHTWTKGGGGASDSWQAQGSKPSGKGGRHHH